MVQSNMRQPSIEGFQNGVRSLEVCAYEQRYGSELGSCRSWAISDKSDAPDARARRLGQYHGVEYELCIFGYGEMARKARFAHRLVTWTVLALVPARNLQNNQYRGR